MLENEYFFADQGDDSACEEITISYDDSDINMDAALTSNAQKDKLQGNLLPKSVQFMCFNTN